jgi:hypothetical protein
VYVPAAGEKTGSAAGAIEELLLEKELELDERLLKDDEELELDDDKDEFFEDETEHDDELEESFLLPGPFVGKLHPTKKVIKIMQNEINSKTFPFFIIWPLMINLEKFKLYLQIENIIDF